MKQEPRRGRSHSKKGKKTHLYSILFLPSSALRYLAVLSPRSCLATKGPSSLSFRTFEMVSW